MSHDLNFEKTDIKIPSTTADWNLDAWKYLPKAPLSGGKGRPVVVM